jgi:hypothetical protein
MICKTQIASQTEDFTVRLHPAAKAFLVSFSVVYLNYDGLFHPMAQAAFTAIHPRIASVPPLPARPTPRNMLIIPKSTPPVTKTPAAPIVPAPHWWQFWPKPKAPAQSVTPKPQTPAMPQCKTGQVEVKECVK